MALVPILPETPASSKASRAADLTGLNPLIGHPLGTIQRLVPRVVTKRISNAASWLKRYGRTPYCMRTASFAFFLRDLLELPTFPFFDFTPRAPAQCGLEFDEAHWTERPAGSVRPASCAALKMETANRNASGAGVKMSTVDGMPQDRWGSERCRGARILAVTAATCSPSSSSLIWTRKFPSRRSNSFFPDAMSNLWPMQRTP